MCSSAGEKKYSAKGQIKRKKEETKKDGTEGR
jgi:hypothetical protein